MKSVFVFVAVFLFGVASGQDWPQFRGAGQMGHSEAVGVPLEWSATENVAWKVPVPGAGWSSPVLVDGRVYVTTAVPVRGDRHELRLLGFDAATGKGVVNRLVFTKPVLKKHRKNSHASATPLVVDGKVYVHFGSQGTACLDLDGKVIWKQEGIDYPMVHGNGGCPVLVDGKLVFSCDGSRNPVVMALDAATGREAWRTPRNMEVKKNFSFATPLVWEGQVISPGSGGVIAYDPANGRELWRARYGEGYSVIPRPVTDGRMVFVGSGYDRATALGIRLGGRGDVTDTHVEWIKKKAAPHTASMLLVDDLLFMASDIGVGSCVDPATGEVLWQERLGGSYSASPVLAEGRIVWINEAGEATVIRAAKRFEVLAKNDLEERTLASPAVTGGALFIRTEGHLFRIGK